MFFSFFTHLLLDGKRFDASW